MKNILFFPLILFLAGLPACNQATTQYCNQTGLLRAAAAGSSATIAKCYKSGADIFVANANGESIYAIALANGHPKLARELQQMQLKVWQQQGEPLTAAVLYEAIAYDNVAMVSRFVSQGFAMDTKHLDGVAPVVWAVFNNSNRVLETLLQLGIDAGYEFDSRPLICIAAMFNQPETLAILIAHGADVNASDGSGVTPLMFAARDGYSEMIKKMLALGADTSLTDIEGHTALAMARLANQSEAMELLGQ